jgi:hypothetical protein
MMDENRNSLFGSLNPNSSNFSQLSPYLNVDPSYLQTQAPEFLVNEEIKRGRLENSFSFIGTGLFVGAGVGAMVGLFEGIRDTKTTESLSVRRTQIVNYTLKSGGRFSNGLGAITFMYSSLYVLMSQLHDDDEDYVDVKNCLSGALTGALYKSSAGLTKSGLGGAFGLGLAALWSLGIRKNEVVSNYV